MSQNERSPAAGASADGVPAVNGQVSPWALYAAICMPYPRHASPRHATPRHATPRHAMPCHAIPCATSNDATRCGATAEFHRCRCSPINPPMT